MPDRVLCIDWRYCEKRANPRWSDQDDLCTTIADVLAACTIGVHPFSLSVLVVKLEIQIANNTVARMWVELAVPYDKGDIEVYQSDITNSVTDAHTIALKAKGKTNRKNMEDHYENQYNNLK